MLYAMETVIRAQEEKLQMAKIKMVTIAGKENAQKSKTRVLENK